MRRNISISAGFLSLAMAAAAAAPLWAQSLADLAKAEEQRRKTIKSPAKVYTNKDLGNVPPPPPVAPPAAVNADEPAKDVAAEAEKAKDEAKPAEGAKDQAYWSGRAKDLQSQLERDQSYAEALQSRINGLTTDWVNRSDPAQRAVIERDRLKALTELDRLTQAIQNDKKAIADLDEEARRSGVPPGWLR
jgi:hypothetical protein